MRKDALMHIAMFFKRPIEDFHNADVFSIKTDIEIMEEFNRIKKEVEEKNNTNN